MADAWAELEEIRREIRDTEEQLTLLAAQARHLQDRLAARREELWTKAQSEEVERAILEMAKGRLAQRISLSPIPGWRYCFHAPQGRFISLDYLADTEAGPDRTLAVRLPFNLLWLMRSRPGSLEVFILGRPDRLLVLPGERLWDWIGVRWARWPSGVFAFTFRWHEEGARCYLLSITQHRPRGRGEETHVCLTQAVDVSAFLNGDVLLSG